MTKKDITDLKEILGSLPTPTPVTLKDVRIDMTDKADKELAKAAGKLADALKAIAERPKNKNQYGVYINTEDER